jgi:CheY-like chemotaxis protein
MTTEGDLGRILATARSSASKCILLAEDNPADSYLIRESLQKHNRNNILELILVTDGEQAIDYILRRGKFAQACRPDLIVLDLNLPKSDGVEVLQCVREQPDLHDVPVVVLTSSNSPRDRSITERLGANRFITKPLDLDEYMALGGTLLTYLEGSSANGVTA